MKINKNFVLKKVANNYVAISVGAKSDFKGYIQLNETGAFIFNCLKEETTIDEIVEKLTKEYDVSKECAKTDIQEIIKNFKENGLIDD